MQQKRMSIIGAVAAGVVLSVSTAGLAAADDSGMTVDAAVPCAGNSYNLSVPAIKLEGGLTSYHFLDGATMNSATQIDAETPMQPGVDPSTVWTPATAGNHTLWLIGHGGPGGFYGPVVISVTAAGDPSCSPSTAVPVSTTPPGGSDLGSWLSNLLSSLSASA